MYQLVSLIALLTVFSATASGQYAESYPRLFLEPENAICRISVADPTGTAHGTGVRVRAPVGKAYVVTAYHVISDGPNGPIQVTWDGERSFAFRLGAARPGCDMAILVRDQELPTTIPTVEIAHREVELGETCYTFGFGDAISNRLRCTGGPVKKFTNNIHRDPVWFAFAGRTRDGDSGGPVFVVRDGTVRLVGVAWGTAFDSDYNCWTVAATRLRVLNRIFGRESSPVNPASRTTPRLVSGASTPTTPRFVSGSS